MTLLTNLTARALRTLPILAALTAPVAALAGPPGVPFSGTFATQETLGFDPSRCPMMPYIVGTTTGSGHASHLGAATGIASDCIMPTSLVSFAFTDGKLVLTAANGDQVNIAYWGTLMPTATPFVSTLTGSYRIDGGTGRFAGATGRGTVSGLENLKTRQGQLGLDGTIAY
jgi:hypothetical protein